MKMRTMPFGKYKGVPLDEIPETYLEWCLTQEWINPDLMEDIEKILNDEYSDDFEMPNVPGIDKAIYKDIIREGYRALAKKYHPDAGGDTVKMQQLNKVYEILVNHDH